VVILLLGSALAACAGGEDRDAVFNIDSGGNANQPFPDNYRPELLAFMRTYLNNPVGVHGAVMADPVQRTVGGRMRYVNGRLERVAENAGELCAGAVYAPFPELEKLTR
jgi:hypothetical protein